MMRFISALALTILATPLVAQKAQLLKDINQTGQNGALGFESGVAELGGWNYFARDIEGLGVELHRAPTLGGATELVRDIAPGRDGAWIDGLTVMGSELFFIASDGVHGRELWKSDGTSAGTSMVRDIRSGLRGSFEPSVYRAATMLAVNGTLWFSANDGAHGLELWRSDGTPAGTFLAADLVPGVLSSLPRSMIELNGDILISCALGLVRVNPVTGAQVVRTFYGNPSEMSRMGTDVFFSAAGTTSAGYELWKSNGTTAGTLPVKDIYPGSGLQFSSYPGLLTPAGNLLYFFANDGVHGSELWVSDGTVVGTNLVADIRPGSEGSSVASQAWSMAPLGNSVLFFADDGTGGTLWKSDGTAPGTAAVVSGAARPTLESIWSLSKQGAAGSQVYFGASDPASGEELWQSDGTELGTLQVADLVPGIEGSDPRGFVGYPNGEAVWFADTGTGPGLWSTAASAPTTFLVADQVLSLQPVTADGNPLGFKVVHGHAYFVADDGVHGFELWKTDGTKAGTTMVVDLLPGPGSGIWNGDPEAAGTSGLPGQVIGDRLFFTGHDSAGLTPSLFVTDGSAVGTVKLQTFQDLSRDQWGLLEGVVHKGELYFNAREGTSWDLWKSDGTVAGTKVVHSVAGTSFYPGLFSDFSIASMGGYLWVGVSGQWGGLWRSTGEPGGGWRILPTAVAENFEVVGNKLFFTTSLNNQGEELWCTDGTQPGTQIVVDLNPGSVGSNPRDLTRVGDLVFFTANDGVSGRELWKSDGTAAGTTMVLETVPGPGSGSFVDLEVSSNRLFFAVEQPNDTAQLWVIDGATTLQLLSFPQSASFFSPSIGGLHSVGSRQLYFQANDVRPMFSVGSELWVTDGTIQGTHLVDDHQAGPSYTQITQIQTFAGRVLVNLYDYKNGKEPYAYEPGATAMGLGESVAPSGYNPQLRGVDPVLGTSTSLSIRDAIPSASGLLFQSPAGFPPTQLPVGGFAFVNPFALTLSVLSIGATGSWNSAPIAIPNDTALIGQQFVAQALVGAPGTAILSMDLTNAVLFTLGEH